VTQSGAPVVAVSPLVRGAVLKGPTAVFMQAAGLSVDADGVVAAYAGLIDGLVSDQRADGVPVLETEVLMDDPGRRRHLPQQTLAFALALGRETEPSE